MTHNTQHTYQNSTRNTRNTHKRLIPHVDTPPSPLLASSLSPSFASSLRHSFSFRLLLSPCRLFTSFLPRTASPHSLALPSPRISMLPSYLASRYSPYHEFRPLNVFKPDREFWTTDFPLHSKTGQQLRVHSLTACHHCIS